MKNRTITQMAMITLILSVSTHAFGIGTASSGTASGLFQFVSNPLISTILLTMGFTGLVVELLTPRFGVGALVSMASFGMYFTGNIMVGEAGLASVFLLIFGLLLMGIELIIPGFGLAGISGILAIAIGVVLVVGDLSKAMTSLSIAIVITSIITVVMIKLGFRSTLLDKITLNNNLNTEKGYLSNKVEEDLLGKRGKTLSELRPSGFAEIEGKKYDVMTNGGFIEKDKDILVSKIDGSKIIVTKL